MHLDYVLNEVGRIMKVANNQYEQHYTISDHLGSARMSVKADVNNLPIVLQYDSYTPFGLEISGLSYAASTTNPNKYNGKELQSELNLNWYDYGARFYDPQIGRWHSVDPLVEKYLTLSSYNFCANNPILFIDIDGREIRISSKPGSVEQKEIFNNLQALTKDKLHYNNENGMVTISEKSDVVNSFGTNLVSDLINGTKADGSNLLVDISKGGSNKTLNDGTINASNPQNGSDSRVLFNYNDGTGGKDVNGGNRRKPFIGLGHELIHARMNACGESDETITDKNDPDDKTKKLTKAEIETRVQENKLRDEFNVPYRKTP